MGIRLMKLSDQPQLEILWKPEHMEYSREYLDAILSRNPDTNFVYEVEGRIVAAACGLYDGRRGFIQSVAVLPDERGKGYGNTVVKATQDALLKLNTVRIRLFVAPDNEDVLPFYKKMGYEVFDGMLYLGLKKDIVKSIKQQF